MNRCLPVLVMLPLTAVLAGCPTIPKTALSLEQLVTEHNANVSRVQKLWANASITVSMPINGRMVSWPFSSGTLLLGKGPQKLGPHDFLLLGREGGQPVFGLGSSVEQNVYYLWTRYGQEGRLWRGRLDLAGAEGIDIPVDPTQLPGVLGILELPSDFTRLPTVALTMQAIPGDCAYVLTYVDHQPVSNKILFKREILIRWSDSAAEPRQPYQINFIDSAGRRVMVAKLANYKPIDLGPDAEKSATPVLMPTDIDVAWPEKNSRLHLMLSGMTTTKGMPQEAARLDPPAGIAQTQVDEFLIVPAAGGVK